MEPINIGCLEESSYSWITVDREKCNKCGTCVEMCPMDALHFGHSGYPYMRYRDDCWYCDVCVFMCPRKAITFDSLPYLIR
jgi:NAD-dependent dihydropyrimidine dehydrogenase PreA subunit